MPFSIASTLCKWFPESGCALGGVRVILGTNDASSKWQDWKRCFCEFEGYDLQVKCFSSAERFHVQTELSLRTSKSTHVEVAINKHKSFLTYKKKLFSVSLTKSRYDSDTVAEIKTIHATRRSLSNVKTNLLPISR